MSLSAESMTSHEELTMTEVKTEVNEAEDERILEQTVQDTMYGYAEDDTRDNMSGPIRKAYTCQWIKTEPVEENETSDVFHQFQSEPVDKNEKKGDIKHESVTGVGLSCGQMSSGTTWSFGQLQLKSSEVKLEPSTDSESMCSRDTEPVYFKDSIIKVKVENDSETAPSEASTSFSVNIWQSKINSYLQTEDMTDIKMTDTSIDDDDNTSSSDEQVDTKTCPTIGQDTGFNNKPANSVTTTSLPFVCDICEKGFTLKHNLMKHKLIHTDKKPFVCDVCEKGFSKERNLKTHMLIHTNQKPFVCDVCDGRFRHKCSLKKHKVTHTGEKPFVCDVCQESFALKTTLKNHKLIHSDIKQFVCDVCNKHFKQKSCLRNHKHTHELPHTTNIRRSVCEVCNKSFPKGYLKQHMLTHSGHKPFVCDVCNKSFRKRNNLTQHMLSHSDIRQFECDVCHKSFKHNSDLARHKLTHSDIKPFACDKCDKRFRGKSYLKKHCVIHTNQQLMCDVCNKSFRSKLGLKYHRTHCHTDQNL